jgi:hypothetical protein
VTLGRPAAGTSALAGRMARGLYEKIGGRAYADFRILAPPRSLHL